MDLENLLQQRVSQLESLIERRKQLQEEIAELDTEIQSVGGAGQGGTGRGASRSKIVAKPKRRRRRRRARNEVPLNEVVKSVLGKNKKGMATPDIESAVLKTGYKTTSKNFRPMIYQTLSKMKETKEVVYDSDAKMYKLTK